jgi:hypothetical protein
MADRDATLLNYPEKCTMEGKGLVRLLTGLRI